MFHLQGISGIHLSVLVKSRNAAHNSHSMSSCSPSAALSIHHLFTGFLQLNYTYKDPQNEGKISDVGIPTLKRC